MRTLSALAAILSAPLLPAQCLHLQAIPTQPTVQTFGSQRCSSGVDLGDIGTLILQRRCPLRVIVTAARNRAAPTTAETDIVVESMVPVHTFQPKCVRTPYRFAWIETCAAGAPVVISSMPSFRTVRC